MCTPTTQSHHQVPGVPSQPRKKLQRPNNDKLHDGLDTVARAAGATGEAITASSTAPPRPVQLRGDDGASPQSPHPRRQQQRKANLAPSESPGKTGNPGDGTDNKDWVTCFSW